MFSTCVMQGVSYKLGVASEELLDSGTGPARIGDVEAVAALYGSMGQSIMTVFLAISGGDWGALAHPLADLSVMFNLLYAVYIVFVVFGVLNVLTGVFVDSAMKAAQRDRDTVIQAELDENKSYLNQIKTIFAL